MELACASLLFSPQVVSRVGVSYKHSSSEVIFDFWFAIMSSIG